MGTIQIDGSTPKLTIGNATAEDALILFDGNAQDFHIGLDDTADDLVIGLGSALGTTTHMAFDETGAVIKPLQPAFSALPSSTQSNMAVGSAVDVAFGTERFDQNADFASSVFTAPVSGRYQLNVSIEALQMDGYGDTYSSFNLVTSNKSYRLFIDYNSEETDSEMRTCSGSFLADMDASDTAKIQFYQSGGSAQCDVADTYSFFTGYLAC